MGAGELGPLIGQSLKMRRVMAIIEQAAPSSAPVIIRGDSGTGKEIVARTIHELSPRHDGPYVAVNCAALPETLMESELFGHERGAFTGADQRRIGSFELANGGTLLLDEITELKPELQAKLLRVIEDRRLRRLGGGSEIALNVRVLAASNQDLAEAVREARLREDLYYRLAVFTIEVPPLCERIEDIPFLVDQFIQAFARANGKTISGVDNQCMEELRSRPWPGNARELRNAIERAVIVGEGPLITKADLPPPSPLNDRPSRVEPPEASSLPVGAPLREVERELILKTLESVGGNRARAAQILGISAKTLYNKLGRMAAAVKGE
jgi:two-component system response regulator HydG